MYGAIQQMFPGYTTARVTPVDGSPAVIRVFGPSGDVWEITGATCSDGYVSLDYRKIRDGGFGAS